MVIRLAWLELSKQQWKMLASAFAHIGQVIILFSLGALFVPEAVGLSRDFSRIIALGFLLSGLTTLLVGVILSKRGE